MSEVTSQKSHQLEQDLESVLYSEADIQGRLSELAERITVDYQGKELTVIAILHGGIIFLADLLRKIDLPLRMETISVSSYHGGTESSGVVTFNQLELPKLEGQHVIVLDDILDTGRTLYAIREKLQKESSPESVRLCALLSKKRERAVPVEADYVGFEIEDHFVVGYGLDYNGQYRNLPLIGVLRKEIYS